MSSTHVPFNNSSIYVHPVDRTADSYVSRLLHYFSARFFIKAGSSRNSDHFIFRFIFSYCCDNPIIRSHSESVWGTGTDREPRASSYSGFPSECGIKCFRNRHSSYILFTPSDRFTISHLTPCNNTRRTPASKGRKSGPSELFFKCGFIRNFQRFSRFLFLQPLILFLHFKDVTGRTHNTHNLDHLPIFLFDLNFSNNQRRNSHLEIRKQTPTEFSRQGMFAISALLHFRCCDCLHSNGTNPKVRHIHLSSGRGSDTAVSECRFSTRGTPLPDDNFIPVLVYRSDVSSIQSLYLFIRRKVHSAFPDYLWSIPIHRSALTLVCRCLCALKRFRQYLINPFHFNPRSLVNYLSERTQILANGLGILFGRKSYGY